MPHDSFLLDVTSRGAYAVVRAEGELDIASVPRLRASIRRAGRRSPRVVVDLRQLAFMDTFALRTLIEMQDEATHADDGSLHCIAGPVIQRLLDLSGTRGALRWIAPEQLN